MNQKSNHTPTWASILTKNDGGVGTECKRETVLEVWNGGDKAFERPIAEVLVAIREHEALNRVAEAAMEEHGYQGLNWDKECPICIAVDRLTAIRGEAK